MSITYRCITCGRAVTTDDVVYLCPTCSAEPAAPGVPRGFARGCLSVEYTPLPGVLAGSPVDPHAMLPLSVDDLQAFAAGGTPMVRPERLVASTGFRALLLKNDTLNPSGSLKDRASLLVAAQARKAGIARVALASTGNAGSSMACAGAALGLKVVLFVPGAAPRAKLLQSLLYGAAVVPVQGTYDEAFALSIEYSRRFGGINRNTAYNPLTVEGKKTVAIEIYNQCGRSVPDIVYVPTGDGVIVSGVIKGFADLMAAGYTEKMPKVVAVQTTGSNAIARSFREKREVVLDKTATIADSLSVARPAAGAMALDHLASCKGRAIEVSDAEASAAQAELAREAGLFVEPSAAVGWAGFRKEMDTLDKESRIVVLLTGTGFKDTAAAERLVTLPSACTPDLESATKLLADTYGVREG